MTRIKTESPQICHDVALKHNLNEIDIFSDTTDIYLHKMKINILFSS